MLSAAGVGFAAEAPGVDETIVQAGRTAASDIAAELAAAKALAVSARRPGSWVIGSDSVVEAEGRVFSKPGGLVEAADHLRFFSGKTIRLTSAVALARNGVVDWQHHETAMLHVRVLSDQFIDQYLAAEWPEVGYCVGVFRMEARGVQLFEAIEGSHFTILGMPLLPLLGALRARGILAA
jgi:septum formation protein